MVLPPGIQRRRRPIHGSLHIAKIGFAVLTGPIASPPVLSVHIDLVVEAVVNRNTSPTALVDPVHVFAELGSMTVAVSVVLGHKQERVNHFMEKSLHQVFSRSELQQRLTESDRTQSTSALI